MKVLNLYAGIGGNRKLWPEECEVTAVEIDSKIANIYQDFFPTDIMIVCDAHQYLLDHHNEFDFIWSSRPCQSHSRVNAAFNAHGKGIYVYPDLKLYEEIIFLKHFAKCKYVVENVIPYYKPLVKPTAIRGRHFFWANFHIPNKGRVATCDDPIEWVKSSVGRYGFDISNYKTSSKKVQILRNMVKPELGLFIFNSAFKEKQMVLRPRQ